MTVETAIAFATFFLENDHVFTFHEGINYLAYYLCAFYSRSTYLNCAFSVNEKNLVKFYSCAFFHISDVVNKQLLASLGAELLSLDFYNCVHLLIVLKVGPYGGQGLCALALICAFRKNCGCKVNTKL